MQFLRLHYPDADFPQEIVRSHIAEDLDARHRLRSFDPLSGNLLIAFDLQIYSGDPWSYVAFPMGETGSQLSAYFGSVFVNQFPQSCNPRYKPCVIL